MGTSDAVDGSAEDRSVNSAGALRPNDAESKTRETKPEDDESDPTRLGAAPRVIGVPSAPKYFSHPSFARSALGYDDDDTHYT